MRLASVALAALLSALPTLAGAQSPERPGANATYRDPRASVDARVADLLARMTREEKFWQLFMSPGDLDDPAVRWEHGAFGLQVGAVRGVPPTLAAHAHAARIDSIQRHFARQTRLGIPIIPFDEALHGLMREGALVYPQAIGLAATFDSSLVRRVHDAVARETRARGIRMVLSPVVNIATDVRWGRTEETFGEDVYLTSVMGRAHVRAFESAGIVTTPKHFVANVGDGGRDSYPIDLSPRALEERHFPPFQSLIQDAGARSVMTAYNSVDGHPATQSRYLMRETLKERWGFDGFIISDAAATAGATVLHLTEASTRSSTEHAFASGLDVIFQSAWHEHRGYWRAVQDGVVPDAVLDSSVARVLRAKFALGLFDSLRIVPDSAAHYANLPAHRALAREAARASLVLLHNPPRGAGAPLLPLSSAVRRLAVIGADAEEVRFGGYSGTGIAPVSVLAAIRARLGTGADVRFARGPGRVVSTLEPVPDSALTHRVERRMVPGLRARYWNNIAFDGAPRVERVDATVRFAWTLYGPARELSNDWYAARWEGNLEIPQGAPRRLAVIGNDGYRLWVDDSLIVDRWFKRSFDTAYVAAALTPGSHRIKLEFFETRGNGRITLAWEIASDAGQRIAEAVAAARGAEAVVVVVGVEEGEFRDRASLALPGAQEELIRAVAATGVPTAVVIVGGSAVTMTRWLDDVGAVLMAWYPGEEGGPAIAETLFGDHSPSGRLPITFPVSEAQLPLVYDHRPTGRGDDYLDLTGLPRFPFGHGLSYSTFTYDSLQVDILEGLAQGTPRLRVRARVTNSGTRAASEVVQLYLRDVLASVAQPVIALKGFARIPLAAGESRTVEFTLDASHLRLRNARGDWVVEPGVFRILVGASSVDLRLRLDITLQ